MTSRCQRNYSVSNAYVSDKHDIQKRNQHPKKNALKRHLHDLEKKHEQGKVLVQPTHSDNRIIKKLKSDWDLLFYNNDDSKVDEHDVTSAFTCDANFSVSPAERLSVSFPPQVRTRDNRRQSFLVKGKEMKSFFHLTGTYFVFCVDMLSHVPQ